ncbi:hypothetical protein K8R14_02525 [bacterium]|nr:hypothetical protein [bacterium]
MEEREKEKKNGTIAPTPKLDAKATEKFFDMGERDLKKPMGPISTPKIDKAIKKVMANARNRKK